MKLIVNPASSASVEASYSIASISSGCGDRRESFIPAISKLVVTMNEGQCARVFATHHYGFQHLDYSTSDGSVIPPYSNLILEVRLVRNFGQSILPGRSTYIMKRILQESKEYFSPKIGSLCTCHIKTYINNTIIKEETLSNFRFGTLLSMTHGLFKALKTMAQGEIAKFHVNSIYAYGKTGNSQLSIPPNQNLLYKVELLSLKDEFDFHKADSEETFQYLQKLLEEANSILISNEESAPLTAGHIYKFIEKKSKHLSTSKVSSDDEINLSDDDMSENTNQDSKTDEHPEMKQKKENILFRSYSNLSLIYIKRQKFSKAKDNLLKALKIQPNNVKLLLRLSDVMYRTNDLEDALKTTRKVLEMEPSNTIAKSIFEKCTKMQSKIKVEMRSAWSKAFST
ncbi:MAG: FK506-binding protein 5 [Paramarteilia canceri]